MSTDYHFEDESMQQPYDSTLMKRLLTYLRPHVKRLVLCSVLLLLALRIQSWRLHRPLGDLTLALIRCLAVIALVEAVRVAQVQHGPMRIALIGALQYIVFTLCVMMLFASTIRETVLFTLGCTIGVVVLWLGSHLGTWIA